MPGSCIRLASWFCLGQRSVLNHAEFKCFLQAGHFPRNYTLSSVTLSHSFVYVTCPTLRSSEFVAPFMLIVFQGLESEDLAKKPRGSLEV